MRLINAEKLIKEVEREFCYPEAYKKMIKAQPTAYDLDEVVRQLETLADGEVDMGCCPYVGNDEMTCPRCYAEKAVAIVKRGGMS